MMTGMSAHSALIARSSSRPSRSGIRTSTNARSKAAPPCKTSNATAEDSASTTSASGKPSFTT